MNVKDKLTVTIIDEDNIGNGIARYNNIVIFIKNALKDEKIEIEITKVNKNFMIGKIINIIEKSNKRIEPICKYYDVCGGCNFLHTSFDNEKDIKLRYLERLFNRKIDYLEVKNDLYYRNKVTLHVINAKLGYFNDKTHEICEIDKCYLLNPKISLKISELSKMNLNKIDEIIIRAINDKIVINIIGNIKNFKIDCDSLYINNNYVYGDKYLIDYIDDYKFTIYPDSFYQVNKEGMINIYNKALEYTSNSNTLLDLYCGTGTIGIWMNKKYKKILGVDINSDSIKNANINKELNNLNNIEFICDDAKNIKGKFDSIIVDPPRSGLSNEVIDYLNNSKSNKIIYISCNPNTLKRDVDLLINYELKDISYTNMFPRTKHLECICILERRTQNVIN